MITESSMYWLTRLDHISDLVSGVGLALAISGGFGLMAGIIVMLCSHSEDDDNVYSASRKAVVCSSVVLGVAFSCGVAWTLIPTSKEYAAIKIVPAIANNEEIKKESKEIYGLGKQWLRETLNVKPVVEETAKDVANE